MNAKNYPAPGLISEPCAEPSTLESLESIIQAGLPHQEEVALALLEIHERKLFKPASFKNYLKNRWNLSRSRGYQLLHLGRLLRMSTTVDGSGPANERQARKINVGGHVPGELKQNECSAKMCRVIRYVAGHFRKTPPAGQRQFITDLRALLQTLEGSLPTPPSSEGDKNCDLQNEPKGETNSKTLVGRTPSSNLEPAQDAAELAGSGKGESRPKCVGNQDARQPSTPQRPGLPQRASVARITSPAEPSPFPLRGFTIEEARKLGFLR